MVSADISGSQISSKPSVVLSTGLGRLHFVKACEAISKEGIDLTVLQGFVPTHFTGPRVLDWLGRRIGSKHLRQSLELRQMPFLSTDRVVAFSWPEILTQLLLRVRHYIGMQLGTATKLGWTTFGWATRSALKDQHIFHVRSGAGGGGAIATAKRLGMCVIADHSIAHPAFLEQALTSEGAEGARPRFSPVDPFWAAVIEDCKNADVILVNSDFVKRTFVDQGFDPNTIKVVYLGVRDDFFSLKTNYAIPKRPLELLFTGSLGPRKGVHYLIQALEILSAEGIEWRLTVLGDVREGLSSIEQSQVSSRIRALGFIPQGDLKSFLASSDIYVFPTLAEGCASSAMEALAAGLPVIATPETGLPATHLESYYCIPSKDPLALASAIKTLGEDVELRQGLGSAAAKLIASRHTWTSYGEQVAALYKQLVPDTDLRSFGSVGN